MNIAANIMEMMKAQKIELSERILDINVIMNMVREQLDEAVGVDDHDKLISTVDDATCGLRALDRLFNDVLDRVSRLA